MFPMSPYGPSATAALPAFARSAPTDLRLRDVRLATGLRLRFAEQGDPTDPTIVLLHGYSDSWLSYGRLLPLLPRDLHVVALDQRGHGDSDRPVDGYTMRELAADVVAFLDARGIARATIVGHSMGGFVAQQVAVVAPDRVERLVLVASATAPRHIVGIDELRDVVGALAPGDAPAPTAFIRDFQSSTVHRAVPAEFMERVVAASRQLPARVWQALMAGMLATDVPTALEAHAPPTLLLWGERDAYCPRAEQEALLRLLGTATLRAYPETGHAPHWERPADVARDLVAFLRRTPVD